PRGRRCGRAQPAADLTRRTRLRPPDRRPPVVVTTRGERPARARPQPPQRSPKTASTPGTPDAGSTLRQVTAHAQSGSPDALVHRGPLRSVRATRRGIRLKQAPGGVSGVERCWVLVCAGCPALAVRVNQAGVVRYGLVRVGDHVLLGDCRAGDPMPLFPLGRAAWLVMGVQE